MAGAVALDTPEVPSTSKFELGVKELRRVSAAPAGQLPSGINYVEVVSSSKPLATAIGGLSFAAFEMPWTSFQIVYEDGFIVVDVPAVPNEVERAGARKFLAALRDADAILFTHEHPDHLAGLDASMTKRAHLNRVQRETARLSRHANELLSDSAATRIAPGVAVRPAPGHTSGSQIVFVRTRGGGEYLLVGDIAWHRIHFEEPRAHPRVSSFVLGEDAEAIGHQLRALHDVHADGGVIVVPSHDGAYLRELSSRGLLGTEFE